MWLIDSALVYKGMISEREKNKAGEKGQMESRRGGGSIAILDRSGNPHFEDDIRA